MTPILPILETIRVQSVFHPWLKIRCLFLLGVMAVQKSMPVVRLIFLSKLTGRLDGSRGVRALTQMPWIQPLKDLPLVGKMGFPIFARAWLHVEKCVKVIFHLGGPKASFSRRLSSNTFH